MSQQREPMSIDIDIPQNAQVDHRQIEAIAAFCKRGVDLGKQPEQPAEEPFWTRLAETGTELWLDSGDIDAIAKLWRKPFSALTTNNTLLNKEVQKGIYDELVGEAGQLLSALDDAQTVIEVAFILNAHHALRLVERFGCYVSVELHTDLAHDVERSVFYGKRYYAICPDKFIIKVPFTASGLIATRKLREAGIPVNHTLGFSARQNHVLVGSSRPNYCNVFLGRLNSYVKDNELGDGENVGEKATLASQRGVRQQTFAWKADRIKQIAASMRSGDQVAALAGVDVHTMPTKVGEDALDRLAGDWSDQTAEDPPVAISAAGDEARLTVLWDIDEPSRALAQNLAERPPAEAEELVERAHQLGAGELFPHWSDGDLATIAEDGKIPVHRTWAERIQRGELAIDTLMNAAGLVSFTADQKQLDDRVREHLA